MRIAADEVVAAPRIALGVTDRVKLLFGEVGVHGRPRDCESAGAVRAYAGL